MISENKIKNIVDKIVRNFNPRKIIIFGSYAKGNPTEQSDLDILVVANQNSCSNRELAARIRLFLWGEKIPMDIIVKKPEEFEKDNGLYWKISYSAARDGVVVYG